MARINIEDSLFKDARFLDLCISCGDKQKALGALVWAFMVAQKYYLNQKTDRLIPIKEWEKQGCDNKLIAVGFAEEKNGMIYVKGSEKQFAWLMQRQEAGKKGGRPSKRNKVVSTKAVEKRGKAGETLLTPYSLLSTHNSLPHNSLQGEGASDQRSAPTMHKLILLWNELCGELPKVKTSNKTRERKIKTVWPCLDESEWVQVIKKLAASDFCNGNNDRAWKADFDFLLKPETYSRTQEGRYDNKTKKTEQQISTLHRI